MHTLIRHEDFQMTQALPERSHGLMRAFLIGEVSGSTHTGLMFVELTDGHLDTHLHSFESSFYILSGSPVFYLDERGIELRPGACGAIPVGVPHAWRSAEAASWIEMSSPRPRKPGTTPTDTFFTGPPPEAAAQPLDLSDPRNHTFVVAGESALVPVPVADGEIAVRTLVDTRLGARLHTMSLVELGPGAVAEAHDHPFEQTFYVLDGEIDVVADGDRHTLRPGDVFSAAVGCIHACHEAKGGTALWLETSAPAPPDRHASRFDRDWDYLAERLD